MAPTMDDLTRGYAAIDERWGYVVYEPLHIQRSVDRSRIVTLDETGTSESGRACRRRRDVLAQHSAVGGRLRYE